MSYNRRVAAKTLMAGMAAAWDFPGIAFGQEDAVGERENGSAETIKTQVCVLGGGSGGIGAALAAARAGAKVVLLEREAMLGGSSTMTMNSNWEPAAGVDGLPKEIYDAMRQFPAGVTYPNYADGSPRGRGHQMPFEPFVFNVVVQRLLAASRNCTVLMDTVFDRAIVAGDRVTAVEAWFHGKHLRIEADVFIDCTADGDVCADAGCEFHMGEDPRSLYHEPHAPEKAAPRLNSMTLCYRISDSGTKQTPYLPADIPSGICPRPTYFVNMPNGDKVLNAVDMLEGNVLLHMSHGEMVYECHRRVVEHFHWLQTSQGYDTWTIVQVGPRIGVRETRRILGEYVLTELDCTAGCRNQGHSDIIAVADHALDRHGVDGFCLEVPHGPYGVPYRCLTPKGFRNLLIASRAASFSHVAASSCRLSRTMMCLGFAAGTAAAMCSADHCGSREVDIEKVRAAVESAGQAVSV